jgi:DNA-binding NarL/FixJ family response regulator
MDILFIDDQPIVFRGAAAVLAEGFPGCSCTVTGTLSKAETRLTLNPPDLVILEPGLAGGDEMLRGIVTRHSRVPVLAFSLLPEQAHAPRACAAARADSSPRAQARRISWMRARRARGQALRQAPGWATCWPRGMAVPRPQPARALLSPRELDTARALARGARLTDIARAMGVSVKTVGTYARRPWPSCHLGSNAELGAAARALGLLAPAP